MKNKTPYFSFGRNWTEYVKNFLDEEKIEISKKSFSKYMPEEEYKGKTFIDIGCGSGIFSLSALRLGCAKVISFDVDPHSINATKLTKEKFAKENLENWEIFEGSILDENLVKRFESQGDVVYSWGVLHHTGNMWKAIENAAKLVKPGGKFIIAIYNKTASSEFWLKMKRFYNNSPKWIKLFLIYFYFGYVMFRRFGSYCKSALIGKPRPFRLKDILGRERGMSIFYDVIDWLGGYPYEFATVEEINSFVEKLNFSLVSNPTKLISIPKKIFNRFSFDQTGCNEFVFKKNENH